MADKFQLKALITGVDKLSPMLKGVQKNAKTLKKQLESSGLGKMSLGDMAGAGAFAAPVLAGVKAAMDFESKMADVKKVVNFDEGFEVPQLAALNKDVLALSRDLPMAANGIAEIYAAGGQSGIARTELKGFATDAIKMGVAFDQTASQSGQMMATWRTAFKLGQAGVVELSDKINHLGNNGPANTKQISAIVTRIGALGAVAGLSTGQVAAMGATMAGVGVAEEVAATGIKNFIGALNKGGNATKAQASMFKALRLDSKQLAKGMQTDAQGTMTKVLTAISKVDKDKQYSTLTTIFGEESAAAIAPLLTNLELLEKNFKLAGDAAKYTGSMEREYQSRAKTTANALQLLSNRAVEVGIVMGNVLLPPFNDFMATISPVVTKVAELAEANPWLVKTVLGAAAGFVALRLGAMGATFALKALLTVGSLTPLGLAIRGIALLAGVVISNWGTIGPYFNGMWGGISPLFEAGWELMKMAFDWSPLGLIVKHWEPIMAWFKAFWVKLEPIIQPIMRGAQWLQGKAQAFVTDRRVAAAVAEGEADGSDRRLAVPRTATSPVQPRQSPLMPGGGSTKQQLQGEMVVRFDNAPPGMRVTSATSSQPGVQMFTEVGRRSLSGG